MGEHQWEIGLCGTFDVENYGDLLFPLLAERELSARLGAAVNLHRFAYRAKKSSEWPYEVTPVEELPAVIQDLDGMLIGGGHLIRFDKNVAPGYFPTGDTVHHPTGYWLTPALIAAGQNVPVIWNAPGLHEGRIPEWAKPLIATALDASRYIAVRSERSRTALQPVTRTPVVVVPDTAFGLPNLLNLDGAPSVEFSNLAEAAGLLRRYIVFQARMGQEGVLRFIRDHGERFKDFQIVVLPIGPGLGEHCGLIQTELPNMIRLEEWPSLRLIAELLGRAEAVVGRSYHLMIAALAYGVPVFTRQDLNKGKYEALAHFPAIHKLPASNDELDADWFLAGVGRRARSAEACAAWRSVNGHWDRVADELRAGPGQTSAVVNRLWQHLPTLLEDATPGGAEEPIPYVPVEADVFEDRFDGLTREVKRRDQAIAEMTETIRNLEETIEKFRRSRSWRLTAPLRGVVKMLD